LLPGVRETKISRFPQLGFSPRGKKSVRRFLSAKAAEMRCCSEFQKWRSAWRGVILDEVWVKAATLASKNAASIGCRTLGRLRVACALQLRVAEFVTNDKRQASLF
jgi:hypothetical protein